jgi:putative ABC transport system permease protein
MDFVVTADYFRTAGIPLLHGRTFTEADNDGAPRVVVVNQEFGRRFLKDQEPIGKQVRLEATDLKPVWSEIVGVVGNVKPYSEDARDGAQVYEPYLQRPLPSFSLVIRTSSDPNGMAPALRKAVAGVDVELPLARVMNMSSVIALQRGGDQLFLRMLGTFAVLALTLAAIGIYGLISYSVGQRSHEIAIRMALGASGRDVRRMVLGQGVKMAAIGGVIGLLPALPLPRVFESIFNGLNTSDPRTYVIVPIVILAVAMFAVYIPARRASRIDPMAALHSE